MIVLEFSKGIAKSPFPYDIHYNFFNLATRLSIELSHLYMYK